MHYIVHVYNETTKFSCGGLDDIKQGLERMFTANDNEGENVHTVIKTCVHSSEQVENNVTLGGFEYNKVLEVEDQVLCPNMQTQQKMRTMS